MACPCLVRLPELGLSRPVARGLVAQHSEGPVQQPAITLQPPFRIRGPGRRKITQAAVQEQAEPACQKQQGRQPGENCRHAEQRHGSQCQDQDRGRPQGEGEQLGPENQPRGAEQCPDLAVQRTVSCWLGTISPSNSASARPRGVISVAAPASTRTAAARGRAL